MPLDWIARTCFNAVHRSSLVYNTCWEDPRVDREALRISSNDRLLVITSAGCNVLDYVLAGASRVFAVDVNPRQNALLELKIAGIRRLDFDDYFRLFGKGRLDNWMAVYQSKLRSALSPQAQSYWDKHGRRFFAAAGGRKSFYFHGSSGLFAYLASRYVRRHRRLNNAVCALLDADTVDEQRNIYETHRVREILFRPLLQWLLSRDTTLAMLGVPKSQRRQLDEGYPGGIVQFIIDRVEAVFSRRPLHDNYFWRVYLTGEYSSDCCPEYLLRDNFERLKDGLIDRISVHTDTLLGFLQHRTEHLTRFVLLDHMDWLYSTAPEQLAAEWQAIVDRASAHARVIWRSAGLSVDFVDPLEVCTHHGVSPVGDLLTYDRTLAEELHERDRVYTYGSFHIATFSAN